MEKIKFEEIELTEAEIKELENLQKIKESYNFEQYKKDAYQFFAKEKTFELSED